MSYSCSFLHIKKKSAHHVIESTNSNVYWKIHSAKHHISNTHHVTESVDSNIYKKIHSTEQYILLSNSKVHRKSNWHTELTCRPFKKNIKHTPRQLSYNKRNTIIDNAGAEMMGGRRGGKKSRIRQDDNVAATTEEGAADAVVDGAAAGDGVAEAVVDGALAPVDGDKDNADRATGNGNADAAQGTNIIDTTLVANCEDDSAAKQAVKDSVASAIAPGNHDDAEDNTVKEIAFEATHNAAIALDNDPPNGGTVSIRTIYLLCLSRSIMQNILILNVLCLQINSSHLQK